MLQVNSITKPMRGNTLWLYVGARCMEAVVIDKNNSTLHVSNLDYAADMNIAAVCKAIATIELQSSSTDVAVGVDTVRAYISDAWLSNAAIPWSLSQQRSPSAARDVREHLQGAGYEVSVADTVCVEASGWGLPRWAVAYPAELVSAIHDLAIASQASNVHLKSLGASVWAAAKNRIVAETTAQKSEFSVNAENAFVLLEPSSLENVTVSPRVLVTMVRPRADRSSKGLQIEQLVFRQLHLSNVLPQAPSVENTLPELVRDSLERLRWVEADGSATCALLDLRQANASDSHQPLWPVWLQPIRKELAINLATPGNCSVLMQWVINTSKATDLWPDTSVNIETKKSPQLATTLISCACLALCFWLSSLAWSTWQQLRTLRAEVPVISGRLIPSIPITQAQLKQVGSVNEAIAALNLPLPELLRALQPPKDIRVALLSLEFTKVASSSLETPRLKVTAESPTPIDMAKYVEFLSGHPPFLQANLLRHEVTQERDTPSAYRFNLELSWKN